MGAEQSAEGASPDDVIARLNKQDSKTYLKAEAKRSRRLSMKNSAPKVYLGDVTAIPSREYSDEQLMQVEEFLTKMVAKLDGQIQALSANDNAGFVRLYQNITAGNNNSALASRLDINIRLNRYTNIVAFDHTRVKVQDVGEHVRGTDYMNANYCHGYKHPNMYIAAQGPLPDTFNAFWQVVWEQKVSIVIMVTNEVEGGKLKCHRYWPDQREGTLIMGKMQVSHNFQEVQPTFVLRSFTIENMDTGEARDVIQYAYTAWPDHGVPNTTKELLQFRATIRERYDGSSPLLVHCSAGVGRTGTYIALDRFLDGCADLYNKESILDIVHDLREARNFMVQSQIQFNYLHSACFDGVVALLMRAQRERTFRSLNEDERQEKMLHEIAADIKAADREFLGRAGISIDAKYGEPDKEQELSLAKKISLSARKGSLFTERSADSWAKPLDDPSMQNSANIEQRLQALAATQTSMAEGYKSATANWQASEYNVVETLSPLESRIQSLVYAEEAWRARGGSTERSVQEELSRQNLAAITLRLESLQQTVMGNEARWRKRLSQVSTAGPVDTAGHRQHTTELLGSLTDRLHKLQDDESNWEKRSTWKKYGLDQFREEVTKERQRQVELMQARQAEEEMKTKQQDSNTTKAEKKALEEKARRAQKEAEEKRKAEVRLAAKKSSLIKPTYDPQTQRNEKSRKLEEEAKKIADAKAAREAAVAAKAQKEEDKKKSQAVAKAKAEAFLKKMK